MDTAPRPPERRKEDALEKLAQPGADVWVASTADGAPAHLVPLSFAWDGEHVVLATETGAATARNIEATGAARLAFGSTRDVVMVDGVLAEAVPVHDASPELHETYCGQADWDPRAADEDFVYLLLRPQRVQVWREADEIAGRTVMRGGVWTV